MNRINAEYEKAYITSLPILKEVVKDLDLNILYYSRGRVRTYQRHGNNPIKLEIDTLSMQIPLDILISITPMDENTFGLGCEDEYWSSQFSGKALPFNQPVQTGEFSFLLKKTGQLEGTGSWSLMLHSIEGMARQLQNSIEVTEARRGYGGRGSFAMLQLSIVSSVPDRYRLLLNRLTEEIRLRDVERKIERSSRTIEFIDRQLAVITDTMKIADAGAQTGKQEPLQWIITGI